MNKKIIIIIVLIIAIVPFILMNRQSVKKEFEKLNNKKKYIKVNIPNDNPFEYIKYNELTKKMKKTSVILIGSSKDQNTRKILKPLIEASEETGVEKIYYIDINKVQKDDLKKIIKKEKINFPSLIVSKNGEIIDYIYDNQNYKKMTKEEEKKLKEKYVESISQILVCNTTVETC